MATSDLRQFYFYQDYIWTPADFDNLQTWIFGSMQSIFEGAHGAAVLSGLEPTPAGGLTLNLAAGIACGESGEILVSPTALNPVIPSPGGSPQNSIVILRPTSTDMTNIPLPTNPSIQVPLHKKKSFQLIVLSKVPGFKNDYPTKQTGDVIVAGVQLLAGAVVINTTDIDLGSIDRPRKRKHRIKTLTGAATLDPSVDDIHELDFSAASGVVQMPDAGLHGGLEVTVIRVDASANEAGVSGFNAQQISGQNYLTLSQWDRLRMYSNNTGWRIL